MSEEFELSKGPDGEPVISRGDAVIARGVADFVELERLIRLYRLAAGMTHAQLEILQPLDLHS